MELLERKIDCDLPLAIGNNSPVHDVRYGPLGVVAQRSDLQPCHLDSDVAGPRLRAEHGRVGLPNYKYANLSIEFRRLIEHELLGYKA